MLGATPPFGPYPPRTGGGGRPGPLGDTGPTPSSSDQPFTPEVVPASQGAAPTMERGAPPSSYAVQAFLEGVDGSGARLLGLTALRSVFIFPGLWVASKVTSVPLTFGQLVGFSLASSATITGGMLGWYHLRSRGIAS